MSKKEIVFLGTGAADSIKYFHSSFFIKEGSNAILIDTGGGAQIRSQLQKTRVNLENIQYIFITHKHIDHIFGLFWILRFLGSKISNGQTTKLTILCSQEVEKIIKTISRMLLKEKITELFDKKIIFKNIHDQAIVKIKNWKITVIDTKSNKIEQLGFSLKFTDGTKLICLGDEPYKDKLYAQCNNADYFVHEAYCLESDKQIFKPATIHHSTVKEAATFATKIDAKNLILFHSEDQTFGKRKKLYTKEAKKYFAKNIFVPDDLETIEL